MGGQFDPNYAVEDMCFVSLFGFGFLVRVSDSANYRIPFSLAEVISVSLETGKEEHTDLSSEVERGAVEKIHTQQLSDEE